MSTTTVSNGARAGSGRPPLAGALDEAPEGDVAVEDALGDFEDEHAASTAAAADEVRNVRRENVDIARRVERVTVR